MLVFFITQWVALLAQNGYWDGLGLAVVISQVYIEPNFVVSVSNFGQLTYHKLDIQIITYQLSKANG